MSRTALYRHYEGDTLLYVGVSCDPIRRMYEHKCSADWANSVDRSVAEWFPSRADAIEAERIAILNENPAHNINRSKPSDVMALIDSWPTRKAFADAIGGKVAAVHKWAETGRIPSSWMFDVVQAAKAAGIDHVTAEWMLEIHSAPAQQVPA